MGEVYLAEVTQLHRKVALKVLDFGLAKRKSFHVRQIDPGVGSPGCALKTSHVLQERLSCNRRTRRLSHRSSRQILPAILSARRR